MTVTVTDENSNKLCVDRRGIVWVQPGLEAPIDTEQSPQAFVRGLPLTTKPVRVLGAQHNASLVCALLELGPPNLTIQLASPRACPTRRMLIEPLAALHFMRLWRASRAAGGWRAATRADLLVYKLAARYGDAPVARLRGTARRTAVELLAEHPVWPALTFMPSIEFDLLAQVVGRLRDPRWYIDPRKPDRCSALMAYAGLEPKRVSAPTDLTRALLMSWASSPADPEHPGAFVWRTYAHAGGGDRGWLRATQRLLLYLRLTWLAATDVTGQWQFVPELFFKTEFEIEAFQQHMASR